MNMNKLDLAMLLLIDASPFTDNEDFHEDYRHETMEDVKKIAQVWLITGQDPAGMSSFGRLAMYSLIVGNAWNHLDKETITMIGIHGDADMKIDEYIENLVLRAKNIL